MSLFEEFIKTGKPQRLHPEKKPKAKKPEGKKPKKIESEEGKA